MSFSLDGLCPPTPSELDSGLLSMRTPSMISSGSLESDIEFAPRIRTLAPVPVVPELCETVTPAVRPDSTSEKFWIAAFGSESAFTVATDAPFSRWRCSVPDAVVTTALRIDGTALSDKSSVVVVPAATTTGRDTL